MQRMRSKANTPIFREPHVIISRSLARKYFRKQVTEILKKMNFDTGNSRYSSYNIQTAVTNMTKQHM